MFKTVVGAATLILAWPATADAQILRIGPRGGVSVRAPFVSVDVSPWGGTRVRAPFTSVDTTDRYYRAPGGYGYAPIPPGQAVPYRDFHAPYFRGYHRDYSQDIHPLPPVVGSPYGEPPLGGIYATPLDGEPIPESSYRPMLPEIYRPPAPRYHIPSYSEVFPDSQEPLEGRSALRDGWQSATDPTRLAERLKDAAERLELSLAVREQGDIWSDYLRCVAIQNLADDLVASRTLETVSVLQARELLGNFEGVVANSSLAWVTRLAGFDDTRQALADLVSVLDAEARAGSFGGQEFGVESSVIESRGWNDDDRVPLPEGEILPAPIPDAVPDAAPEPAPQPVFRGEV